MTAMLEILGVQTPGFFIFCQEYLLNDPLQLKDILDVRKVMVPVKRL